MSLLKLENVSKSFGSLEAIKEVSFTCQEGEFFTLFGPSGAGKTTILECIAGIKKGYSGQISIKGQPLEGVGIQERNIAMAFENYALYPHLTVGENIAFPLRSPKSKKINDSEIQKKVQWVADELGIGHLLERMPVQLSGGQKQRVSLARCLVREANVYLLDEPIAHLDANLRTIARANLKAMAKNLGATIVYVTHDFREALGLSDRILILNEGRVLQIDTPRTIYHQPATDYVGHLLGDPAMNLVDGQIIQIESDLKFEVDAIQFPLNETLQLSANQRLETGQTQCRLGVRPSEVAVSVQQVNHAVSLPIYTIEHASDGDKLLIYFEVGGVFFGGFADTKENFTVGQSVWVQFKPDRGHLFDASF